MLRVCNLFLSILFIILIYACSGDQKNSSETTVNGESAEVNTEVKGSLVIATDDIILPVMEELLNDFKIIYPNVKVSTMISDSKTSLQSLDSGNVDIICSSLPESSFQSDLRTSFPVASDILTLIVNFNHPELQTLVIHGISANTVKNILNESVTDWKKVHPTITMSHPLKAFIPPRQSGAAEYLATFTGSEPSSVKVSDTPSEKDVLKNVSSMQVSLGFCSHTLAYDFSTGFRKSSIYIVGTDWNNSGTLENNELIWDELDGLKNAYLKKTIPSGLVRVFSVIYLKKSKNPVIQYFIDFMKDSGAAVFEKYGFYSINNK